MTSRPHLPQLPHAPGVYLMRDLAGSVIYIGKARNLKKRVASYFTAKKNISLSEASKVQALVTSIRHIDYLPTASEREALLLERRLIRQIQPPYNTMWKDDKSYPYVTLTMGDDYPRLILTRKKKKDKSIYFGPYPSVKSVRKLLRWAWRRKFAPLRPCDLEIKENQPYPYEKVKSCLYLHTGECPAPCLSRISKKKYSRLVERTKWFFSGNTENMRDQWEKEMMRASQKLDYEKAADLRDRMEALQHMGEKVSVREMSESMLDTRLSHSRAVQDLRKALMLKNPPERIECFDISHFQGTEKVASMVSFKNGRPDKSQYRKFIIQTVKGIDDFQSMEEVVYRRYSRLKREKLKMPDLVLIDGGKGQLSSAMKALSKAEVSRLDVAALAKEEELVFRPEMKDPIRLPMDSAALLLLRQIRDEAHRFAIQFHRKRRKKLSFPSHEEDTP